MNFKLNNKEISYLDTMQKYQKMDDFVKNTLENLLNKNSCNIYKLFDLNDIIQNSGNNNLEPLHEFKNCCGVYIFLTEGNEPAYIGFGGEKNQDLFERIAYKQFRGDTLEKNIREIEQPPIESGIKQIIKKYTPKLLVIPTGELNDSRSIQKAKVLETLLIALLHCKYNKK
jgi:hypothetical protein